MALWCRNVPTVDVPHGRTLTPLTLVVSFYENHTWLDTQATVWRSYAAALAAALSIVIVDDGSPVPCVKPANLPSATRLFRIETDVRWNWLAARNIGAHHAADGWILLTDIDHVVPERTLEAILTGVHDPTVVYAFHRREHTGQAIAPHSASFLMTRAMFWTIGGYDERLAGFYGTDGYYRRRLVRHARLQLLGAELVRHEHVGDASTRRYGRKEPQDGALRALVATLAGPPRTLSFPYHEVLA
jgi:hypothetical protein